MSDAENSRSVIVVDDDPGQRNILEGFLEGKGYGVRSAQDAETALRLLEEKPSDLVLMDVRMPGMGGIEGLRRMRLLSPPPFVILLTAFADVRDAVEAMRCGAADYLEKPVDLEELLTVVSETIGRARAEETPELPPIPEGFVVASDAMRRVVREAALVAPTEATVLITGESGTGKEVLSEFIHGLSRRRGGPFVRVNCAAIPETLVESELFGHKRGAFTSAEANRVGRFEAADGGTVLLDEVGELPTHVQPKLLRVLEDGTFERVGESESRKTDVRVVGATNRNLEDEVRKGRFREDLFWRLNVFRIQLPPLRERREEIPHLVRHFLSRAGRERARASPATVRLLEAYDWPGNARELSNVVERAAILAPGDVILPEHLPDSLRLGNPAEASSADSPQPPDDGVPRPLTVDEAERRAIGDALRATDGNRTRAAKLLGISRRTLLYRLKRYGINP